MIVVRSRMRELLHCNARFAGILCSDRRGPRMLFRALAFLRLFEAPKDF